MGLGRAADEHNLRQLMLPCQASLNDQAFSFEEVGMLTAPIAGRTRTKTLDRVADSSTSMPGMEGGER